MLRWVNRGTPSPLLDPKLFRFGRAGSLTLGRRAGSAPRSLEAQERSHVFQSGHDPDAFGRIMKRSLIVVGALIIGAAIGGDVVAQSPERALCEHPFEDIDPDWHDEEVVTWAYCSGITTGVSATEFGYDRSLTRAQAVTFLWRARRSPEPEASGPTGFEDVPAGAYYEKAVRWAVEEGVTRGTSATEFSPQGVLNLGQAQAFITRVLTPGQQWVPDETSISRGQFIKRLWGSEVAIVTTTNTTTSTSTTTTTRPRGGGGGSPDGSSGSGDGGNGGQTMVTSAPTPTQPPSKPSGAKA